MLKRGRQNLSEGQIIGSTFLCTLLCRRERGRLRSYSRCCATSCRRERGCLRSSRSYTGSWGKGRGTCVNTGNGSGLGNGLGGLATEHVESIDAVIPASLVLLGIDIKLDGDFLARLNIEHLDTFLAENTEHHATRILSGNFQNIFLVHPGIARTG